MCINVKLSTSSQVSFLCSTTITLNPNKLSSHAASLGDRIRADSCQRVQRSIRSSLRAWSIGPINSNAQAAQWIINYATIRPETQWCEQHSDVPSRTKRQVVAVGALAIPGSQCAFELMQDVPEFHGSILREMLCWTLLQEAYTGIYLYREVTSCLGLASCNES